MPTTDRPHSLWRDTAPDVPVETRAVDGAEIVIAGAGLTGLAAAVMLARSGHRVVVIDAAEIGARTTGASTAKLSLLQGAVYSGILRSAGEHVLRAYARAQRDGQSWLRAELADTPDAEERRLAITYAMTAAGDANVRAEATACRTAGIEVERRSGQAGLPFPVSSALVLEDQSQLHPMRALDALAGRARALGVHFIGGCRLTGAEASGDGVRARTSRGTISAQRLLVTTGFPVVDRRGFFAKLTPTRQMVAAYRLPDPAMIPDGMFLCVDEVTRSLRSGRDEQGRALLVVGGSSYRTGTDPDTRQRLQAIDRWTAQAFPGAVRDRWWAAQDYRMAGDRPFFGILPGTRGRILAATGFAKWGMTNAVAGALALTGIVDDAPAEWAEQIAHARVGARGAAAMVRSSASVATEAVQGWARPEQSHAEAGERARVLRRGLEPVAESDVDGRICAVSAVCTHMGGVLRWNTAERSWDCPLHGSRFAPDGRVIEGPATRDLPRRDGKVRAGTDRVNPGTASDTASIE